MHFALFSILVVKNGAKFGEHPFIVRCMKGILSCNQPCLKKTEIADTLSSLSLKELTLHLTMLLCLTTEQRGQTIHKLNVNCIQEMDGKYRITRRIAVCEKLKQTHGTH